MAGPSSGKGGGNGARNPLHFNHWNKECTWSSSYTWPHQGWWRIYNNGFHLATGKLSLLESDNKSVNPIRTSGWKPFNISFRQQALSDDQITAKRYQPLNLDVHSHRRPELTSETRPAQNSHRFLLITAFPAEFSLEYQRETQGRAQVHWGKNWIP